MQIAEPFNYTRLRWDRGVETILQLADEGRVGAEGGAWPGLALDDDSARDLFETALEDLAAARDEWTARYDELLDRLHAEVLRRSGTPAERCRRLIARRAKR